MAGLKERHGRVMINRFGVQGADQADVIGAASGVRKYFAQMHARIAKLWKFVNGWRDRKRFLSGSHAGKPLATSDRIRQFLFETLAQSRFVIE